MKNFSFSEFGCRCNKCEGPGGLGFADKHHIDYVRQMMVVTQLLRQAIGRPIAITSGWRCPAHNEEVGGADKSWHLDGLAADISIVYWDKGEIAVAKQWLEKNNIHFIEYIAHIHIDLRNQV